MGATLDIQRQQRMDLLDQQLLLAQYNEARRNARHQPQVEGHAYGLESHWCTAWLQCQNLIHFKHQMPHRNYICIQLSMQCLHTYKVLDFAPLIVCLCVCRLGCYSGPGCSPPWDTEDRTDPQYSPAPRPRRTHPHSRRYWTTHQSQRSRWVFACVSLSVFTHDTNSLLSIISRYYFTYFMTWMTQNF